MYWLLTTLLWAQEGTTPPQAIDTESTVDEVAVNREIYIAAPTIHDPMLQTFSPYITSLVVASSGTNSHWVRRTGRASSVVILDPYTIKLYHTNCNYGIPLGCGVTNGHWVLITDIMTSDNFATIILKLYDEKAHLIASTSKSSYSVEKCKTQVSQTTIDQQGSMGQSQTTITEKLPDKCVLLKPSILDKDIKQAVTILFASIHPL